jgi:CheY-like chemotaxis protein
MPRLLLVEDEQVNRELFRRRLERKGYAVVPAESGLSAVALTKTERPDLVLMDLGLPDIDGWEATRRLKADPATARIPVIALSAHATTVAREKALAAGCEEFETKPVDWDALFRKIDAALARAKAGTKPRPALPPDDEVDFGGPPAEPVDPTAATEIRRVKPAAPPDVEPSVPTAEPVVPTAEPVVPAAESIPMAAPVTDAKQVCAVEPKRILVVEDNDANRVMLCRRLNARGYATGEAADGAQALDMVVKQRFDIVLCDIMMPGVDGYTVLQTMKADPDLANIPIVMISALDEMDSIVRCIELGADDYLHKPYEPVILFARVNACLDKRRLRDLQAEYLRAVADLTRAAQAMEKGEYDPRLLSVVAERDDELGTLARVFATLAYQVQNRAE